MARLFTAIELGPAAREAVVATQSEIVAELGIDRGALRTVRPEHLHLTLVFIGEIAENRVGGISEVVSASIPLSPFDIAITECGVFPPRGPARVLWLGIDDGADALVEVFDVVSRRLERAGVPRETRPFTPHLTIGRFRDRGVPVTRLHLPRVSRITDRVSAVTLFQSRLLPGGPEHIVLSRARLGSGPEVERS